VTALPYALGQAYAGVIGLVIGSFLAVCIVRLPEDRSLLIPSHCPHCATPLRWRDNIPVVSWLSLRGKCRTCSQPISPLYPLVETFSGLLAVLLFRRVFPSPDAFDAAHLAGWLHNYVFLSLLVVLSYVDLRYRFIPDETSIYAAPVGIATAGLADWFGWDGFGAISWQSAVFGSALWGGLFLLLKMFGRLVGRDDALGWGDVKLVAMFGAFLGPFPGTHTAVLLGSLSGAIVGIGATLVYRRRVWLPFGPSLALGAALWVLWGPAMLGWAYSR
jgi:leader peptidase (prepilin peptidase) / N-methyltransferase